MMLFRNPVLTSSALALLATTACAGTPASESGRSVNAERASVGLDPSRFLAAGLGKPIAEVPCTLSNGSQATCYQVELKGAPANHQGGPFCPPSIDDNADKGGKWSQSTGRMTEFPAARLLSVVSIHVDG